MIRVVAICDTCAHQHQVSHLDWSTVTCTKCGAHIPNTFPDECSCVELEYSPIPDPACPLHGNEEEQA